MAPALLPEQINVRWGEAFNAGELTGMLELYEPDAVLVPQPGSDPISGHAAIEDSLGFLVGLGAKVSFEPRYWIRHGDLAMGSITFHMSQGTAPDGKPFEMHGVTSEVVRRQGDGSWKYVFDHPFTDGAH